VSGSDCASIFSADYLVHSLGNAFSFWQNQPINNATATYFDDMQAAIGHIQDLSGSLDSIRVMNGETGWPTGMTPLSFPSPTPPLFQPKGTDQNPRRRL
jgi:exo-beta-1,3-glucanase (GH17 family)